jgi:hypothetical protein
VDEAGRRPAFLLVPRTQSAATRPNRAHAVLGVHGMILRLG